MDLNTFPGDPSLVPVSLYPHNSFLLEMSPLGLTPSGQVPALRDAVSPQLSLKPELSLEWEQPSAEGAFLLCAYTVHTMNILFHVKNSGDRDVPARLLHPGPPEPPL